MKIFKNHIIREKIFQRLSNVDATNLMAALRPTDVWDELFEHKIHQNRAIFCPICMLNAHLPILYQKTGLFGSDWRTPINSISYPFAFVLDQKVYPEVFGNIWQQESEFIFTESQNLFNHQNRYSINPKSSESQKTDYFKKLDWRNTPSFDSEKDLISHYEKVKR